MSFFRVSVFGTGHVGLVTGTCLADVGHQVICADTDEGKISQLSQGQISIHEPGLKEQLQRNLETGRLRFTQNLKQAIHKSEILLLAVGTPETPHGAADLTALLSLCELIAQESLETKTVIVKSTVPVGTNRKIRELFQKRLHDRKLNFQITVVSNPEFLREGAGVEETFRPTRIIAGSDSPEALLQTRSLYSSFWNDDHPFLEMSPESAEFSKYAANTMLAARISIMNEFAEASQALGADIEQVREGLGWDPRIGPQFLHAGLGFGGPCLPKDLKALLSMSEGLADMKIMKSVLDRNGLQKQRFIERLTHEYGSLQNLKIAFWGLSFKPRTDDVRDSIALELIHELKSLGCQISAFDPLVSANNPQLFSSEKQVRIESDAYEAARGAHVLCLVTEWQEFAKPNFEKLKSLMAPNPMIFDGRNFYDPSLIKNAGFRYLAFGRR